MKKSITFISILILSLFSLNYFFKHQLCIDYNLFQPVNAKILITVNQNKPIEFDLNNPIPQRKCNKIGEYYFQRRLVISVSIPEKNYEFVDTVNLKFNENARIQFGENEKGSLIVNMGKSYY